MTKQKSIERLALFMGWRKTTVSGMRGVEWAWTSAKTDPASFTCAEDYWDPFTRIDDAMMVAEKIGGLILEHCDEDCWEGSFPNPKTKIPMWGDRPNKAPAEAIALAALAYLDAMEKTK